MEPDHPPAETSDDLKPPSTTTHQQQQQQQQKQTTSHTQRSYDCHFCKRGFTNAQALGGHMNIHRKDKNKLKHSSSTTTTPPHARAEPPSPTHSQPSPTATSMAAANPFSISHHGNWFSPTPHDEKKPLPLFDNRDNTAVPRNIHEPENAPLQDGDVDLELRLGHVEPLKESLSEDNTITTRNFF